MEEKNRDEMIETEATNDDVQELMEQEMLITVSEYFAMKNEIAALKSENGRLIDSIEDVSREFDRRADMIKAEYRERQNALNKNKIFIELGEYQIKNLLAKAERIETVERLYRSCNDRLCVDDIMTVLGIALKKEDE